MGSTALIEGLQAAGFSTNCPNDSDGLKHKPEPVGGFDRIIYVWNDPLLAVLSLARRGYLAVQHKKIGGREQFDSLRGLWERVPDHPDIYGFQRHWTSWQTVKPFQFDWRSRSETLEQFLACARPLTHLQCRPRTSYDLNLIPIQVKEVFAFIDFNCRS